MSEAKTLFKVMLVLGVLMTLMITMVQGGAIPDTGQAVAWNNLRNTLANGVTWPSFNNPFSQGININLGLTSPPNDASYDGEVLAAVGTANGCAVDRTHWQNCVIDPGGPDLTVTYITINTPTTFSAVDMRLTGVPGTGYVQNGIVTLWCRSSGPAIAQMYALVRAQGPRFGVFTLFLDDAGEGVYCKPGTDFTQVTLHLTPALNAPPVNLGTTTAGVQLEIFIQGYSGVPATTLDISTVSASMYVTGSGTNCGGADFFTNTACSIGQAFNFVVSVLTFIVNGIIFVVQVLVAVLAFIGNVIVNLFLALFTIFAIFFNLGAPGPIQTLIDVVMVGLVAWTIFVIARLIRGSGPV